MSGRPYILAETTWRTVHDTPYEVAVLPWGATEAHNFHLPYATDTIQCDHVAARAAEHAWNAGAKVVVPPTMSEPVPSPGASVPLTLTGRLMVPDPVSTAPACAVTAAVAVASVPSTANVPAFTTVAPV